MKLANVLKAKLHAAILNALIEQTVGVLARHFKPMSPFPGSEESLKALTEQLQPRSSQPLVHVRGPEWLTKQLNGEG